MITNPRPEDSSSPIYKNLMCPRCGWTGHDSQLLDGEACPNCRLVGVQRAPHPEASAPAECICESSKPEPDEECPIHGHGPYKPILTAANYHDDYREADAPTPASTEKIESAVEEVEKSAIKVGDAVSGVVAKFVPIELALSLARQIDRRGK